MGILPAKIKCSQLTLSRPLDVNYVLDQGQGHGHLSKYLISGLIFLFFHVFMKKASNPSLKKRSLDISLQHKNRASKKFSKKKLLYLAENRAGAERVNLWVSKLPLIPSIFYPMNPQSERKW